MFFWLPIGIGIGLFLGLGLAVLYPDLAVIPAEKIRKWIEAYKRWRAK